MAGGSQPKSSSHKPSSSASASQRKSRWESSSALATADVKNPPSDSKSNDRKLAKSLSNSNPSPRLNTGLSPKPVRGDSLPPPLGAAFPFPDLGPPPPPTYGFHMLERRTIVLADGSVRSYFALPLDYQDFPPRPPLPPRFVPLGLVPTGAGGPRFPPMSPEGLGFRDGNQSRDQNQTAAMKRKHSGGGEEEFKYGNNPNGIYSVGAGPSSPFRRNMGDELRAAKYMRIGGGGGGDSVGVIHKHLEVDQNKLKKAFLHFVKVINESEAERRRYLENGKHGRLLCVACSRFGLIFAVLVAF